MALILYNQTSTALNYQSNTISVPANGSLSVSPGQAVSLSSDTNLLNDVGNFNVNLCNGYQQFSGASALDFLKQFFVPFQFDSDGALLSRVKQAPTGWTYQLRGIEFKTSDLSSLVNLDPNGNAITDANIKLYDASGVLTTISSLAVKTVVDLEPAYDYYIIGGIAKILATPAGNVRLGIIAVPDVPAAYGGSKVMVSNVNFKYMGQNDKVDADGRASKQLSYSATNHTNKLRFILTHDPGATSDIAIYLEHFKI